MWILCGHVFSSCQTLQSFRTTKDDDHLGKLRRLADAYGWEEDSPQYKAKLKQVQALGKQRLADALGKGGGGAQGEEDPVRMGVLPRVLGKGLGRGEAEAGEGPLWPLGSGPPLPADDVGRHGRPPLHVPGQE